MECQLKVKVVRAKQDKSSWQSLESLEDQRAYVASREVHAGTHSKERRPAPQTATVSIWQGGGSSLGTLTSAAVTG